MKYLKYIFLFFLMILIIKNTKSQSFNYTENKLGYQTVQQKLVLPNGNIVFCTTEVDSLTSTSTLKTSFYILNSKTNILVKKNYSLITDNYVIVGQNLLKNNKILLCGFERIKNQTLLYQAAVMVMCDSNYNVLWKKSYPVIPVEPNVISIGAYTLQSKTGELYLFGTQRKAKNSPNQNDARLLLTVKTDSIGNLVNQVTHNLTDFNIIINVNYHPIKNKFTIMLSSAPEGKCIFSMDENLTITDSVVQAFESSAFFGQDSYYPTYQKGANKNNFVTSIFSCYRVINIDSTQTRSRLYNQIGYYEVNENLDSVYFNLYGPKFAKNYINPYGVAYDGDSIMYIAAYDSVNYTDEVYDNDQYITKINTKTKQVLWEKYIRTPNFYYQSPQTNSLFIDNYGSLIIFGSVINRKNDKDYDMFFMKIDTLGNLTSNIKNTPYVYFWNVFPNPSTTEINISLELINNTLPHIIKITDMLGKEVFTQKYISETEQIKLNTSNYKSGNYIIQWYTGNTLLSTKKIMIN